MKHLFLMASTVLIFCAAVFADLGDRRQEAWAAGGERKVPALNTNSSGPVTIPAAGNVASGDNPDCGKGSKCVNIVVYLPLGAQVKEIRYYHRSIDDDHWYQNSPGEDLRWAVMEAPVQTTTPKNVVVSATFKNWSHNRSRIARVDVDWTRPQEVAQRSKAQ